MKTINEKYQFDQIISTIPRNLRSKFRMEFFGLELAEVALKFPLLVDKANMLLEKYESDLKITAVVYDQADDCYIWTVS